MVTSTGLVFLWVTSVINALSAKGQTLINFNGKWAVLPVFSCIFCVKNCLHNNALGLALVTCTGRCITSGTGTNPVTIKLCKLKCLIWRHDKPSISLGDNTPLFLIQLLTCGVFFLTLWSGVATEFLRGNQITPGCQEGEGGWVAKLQSLFPYCHIENSGAASQRQN